jgi:hypothetical protein
MKAIVFAALVLILSGCNASNDFRVTAYKTLRGAEAEPWTSVCLVTLENRSQRIVAFHPLSCTQIQIGNKFVFNPKGDTIILINDVPYEVRSAQRK